MNLNNKTAIIAIAKDEDEFIEEWIIYHKLIGFDHFFILDNNRRKTLSTLLKPLKAYVTVINFNKNIFSPLPLQVRAYNYVLHHHAKGFLWVLPIDIDEFLCLKRHDTIGEMLEEYNDVDAIKIHSKNFGHNGYYRTPKGLVIENYNRCSNMLNSTGKTIVKTRSASKILNHFSFLKKGGTYVDSEKKVIDIALDHTVYSDLKNTALIYHYRCKSYLHFLGKFKRGDVMARRFFKLARKKTWRWSEKSILREFVTNCSFKENQDKDFSLGIFAKKIKNELQK